MQRMKAVLQYDGTGFRGWQRQRDAGTVQELCERALTAVLGSPVDVVASGRTDTGVHARGQVVHFDCTGSIAPPDLRRAWNAHLPNEIWVERLSAAPSGFHARFDAVRRTYRYFLGLGPRAAEPFRRRYAWPIDRSLDWPAIEAATAAVVGTHDFRRFAKGAPEARSSPGRPPGRCTVERATWRRTREGRALEIVADRFLRHMVRAIAGALVAVGRGRLEPDAVAAALSAGGPRPQAGYAPPCGLFLWRVDYREADDDEETDEI